MARLVAEEGFRDKILAHLKAVGSDSISGIARALSDGRTQPVHRLTVAGYLIALTETGMLREVPRPPSKHYQLANPRSHRTLYDVVGQAVRDVPMHNEQRAMTALATLVRVLGRPVFRAELIATRFPLPDVLPRVDVEPDRRGAILQRIRSRPHPRIEVPRHDPLLGPPEHAGPVDEVLRRAVLEASDAHHLADERRAMQLSLPDIPESP